MTDAAMKTSTMSATVGGVDPPVIEVDLSAPAGNGHCIRALFTMRYPDSAAVTTDSGTAPPDPEPWQGFTLGVRKTPDVHSAAQHRRQLADFVGASVVFGRQIHSATVQHIDQPPDFDVATTDIPFGDGCDALVTTNPQLALGVLTADCLPILLADPIAGVVAAVHAGRVGLLGGIIQSAVAQLQGCGANGRHLRVAIGPAAGACCYEVPDAMAQDAYAQLPAMRATTRAGTPSLDLPAGARSILAGLGITDIQQIPSCTIEDPRMFSYRRNPNTGRIAGVIRLLD